MKVFAAPGGFLLPNLNQETALNSLILDLPGLDSFMQRKHDVLARFIHILNPLIELYKIPPTSLQVFADKEGQLIFFNRSGCLIMNLRYFEAWRTSWILYSNNPILIETCQMIVTSSEAISRGH